MIIRILFLAIIIGIILFLINFFISLVGSKMCKNCNGEGYWKGTRGDKNLCKVCNGTGQNN